MLCMDNKIADPAVFETIALMIRTNAVKPNQLVELFYFTGESTEDKIYYYVMVNKDFNSVSVYFPTASKKIHDKDTKTEFFIIIDLNVETDGDESFNRLLSKYSIAYSGEHWYGSFIEAVKHLQNGKSLKSWTPPEKPKYYSDDEDYGCSDEDLDEFLDGISDDDDEDYNQDEDDNEECEDEDDE